MGNCDSCASPRSRAPTQTSFEEYLSNIPKIKHERISYNEENDDIVPMNYVNYRIVPVGRKPSEKQIIQPNSAVKKHIGI